MLMHPNLVAGAWVGFNDARVTMRSSYWGQGGHNALHVVGDFMRQALDRNMLDGEAGFPRPARAPLLVAAPARDPLEQPGIIITEDSPAAPSLLDEAPPSPASGIVVRREGGRLWAGDSQAHAQPDERPALSEEDLGRVLSGMGRDPASGARMAARRAVETGTDKPDRMSGSSDGGTGSTGSGSAEFDSLR
jgi:penicillin-binding protein 1A